MRRPRVSEAHFTVSYDGPALAAHEMDVTDLARSLLALSSAIRQAQRLTDPITPAASLHVRATQPGSFEMAMVLIQPGILDGALDLLAGRETSAVVNAAELAAMVFGSIRFVKWLKGRGIKSARPAPGPGETVLETEDGDTIVLDDPVLKLARDLEYRKKLSEVLEPLDRDGVDAFKIKRGGKVEIEVTSSERQNFAPPALPEEEELGVTERQTLVQAVGVEFDWRKWRFTEGGGSPFAAAIDDEAFRERVENQEVQIGPQDLLRVSLTSRQYRDRTGALKAQLSIGRVIEIIDGGRQVPFEFDG